MLHDRLIEGYARISDAIHKGQDTSQWESFWVDLLHQYEAALDEEERGEGDQ